MQSQRLGSEGVNQPQDSQWAAAKQARGRERAGHAEVPVKIWSYSAHLISQGLLQAIHIGWYSLKVLNLCIAKGGQIKASTSAAG